MKNSSRKQANPAVFKSAVILLAGLFAMVTSGCEERTPSDGVAIDRIVLPTDLLLNLACENAGIFNETCVLADSANPFRNVATFEFDVNNPEGPSKFELFEEIPAGPTGAKARFYLFASALARRQSGENQWYTARALHELYSYNNDDVIRQQALKAYRSNLDNFYGSAVFFDVFGFGIPASLNEQVACDIVRPPVDNFIQYAEIVPGTGTNPVNDLDKLQLFGEWGFIYMPGPDFNNPQVMGQGQCRDGVLSTITF